MKVGVDQLPEGLKLAISQTDGYTVVAVDFDGERQGKLYISRIGVVLVPGNSQRKSGEAILWSDLWSLRAPETQG